MKARFTYYIIGVILLFTESCVKSDVNYDLTPCHSPCITAHAVTEVRAYTAKTTKYLVNSSSWTPTREGFCLGTSPNPDVTNSITPVIDTLISGLIFSNLTPNTTYYLRAYAENSYGLSYSNEITFTTKQTVIAIGEDYGGGTVFYIDGTGQHGLSAAPFDIDEGARWSPSNTSLFSTNTAINAGQANTTNIISVLGTTGDYAALKCRNTIFNGYSDWFLPSKDELDSIRNNLYLSGIAEFSTGGYYWSSSANIFANPYVYAEYFGDGTFSYKDNTEFCKIRSCRMF